MNKHKIASAGFMALTLSILAFSAQATNLVTNGDFELFSGGFSGAPSQLNDAGTNDYTKLTDWTVGPGSSGTYGFLFASGAADTTGSHSTRFSNTFNLWGPGAGGGSVANGLPASSPDGGNYVALDAAASYRGNGISQSIAGLTIGDKYEVSFDWAAAQQHGFSGATTESVQVDFGASTLTTSLFSLASHDFSGWMHQTFHFTAASVTQTLRFLAVGGPDSLPPTVLLDGVTLNVVPQTAVPEPETYALLGIGLVGFLAVRRQQKHRRA